ncbi:chromosome segregation protein SMC [Caldalkalibacillus salinus]|uniref:chromosome segregation protein SMC n=1 Tax=Caldalkalibacillus salinus TaxID=2803787 RepID=UPI00192103D3|nr:chromosome segregation protein SMC [Caldalkalibacillus salinus]
MYLKKLELYGFKSFADRTELEFVPGVTAVVGPNGSGKSNVSDAIRWVLGEQSAKSLRGSKMEDIIFAGSDTRRPLNYGEVTLVLDNGDEALPIEYAEVAITRRVYRSGDSEYFLNKQSCRLKDIAELFMDTGLGKEAYSIIGQGRIEEILSSKAEDRRGIFEEAAGVVKYKNRKREAERRLDETEANLIRIQDIIYELEGQLEPLRIQAEKAKRYKELKASLTKKEISTLVYAIETTHKQWEEASSKLSELRETQQQLSVEVSQEDAKLQEHRWKTAQLEQKLEESHQQLLDITEEVEKLEGQREVLRERKKNFSTNKQDVIEKLNALKERRQTHLEELEQRKQELEVVEGEVSQAKAALNDEEQSLKELVYDLDEKLESLKSDYINVLNEQASAKNDLRYAEQNIEQNKEKIQKLDTDHQQYIDERADIVEQIKDKQDDIDRLQQQIEQLRSRYQETANERKALIHQIEQEEEQLRQTVNDYEKKEARQQLLTEMKNDFTGYFQGVKEVLKAREQYLDGIDGSVAELIQVPKKVEMAIETALGGALQHVVVQDEASAREAIRYLKQRRSGRATFLPRNVIRPRSVNPQDQQVFSQSDAFVGVASDLVHYDDTYKDVVGNLLGTVIVTRELKAANELARNTHYRYRFVTLEGDIVNPGGSMSGGSAKKNQTNLLGRERELERLAQELKEIHQHVKKKKAHITDLKAQNDTMEQQLEDWRTQGEEWKALEQQKKDDFNQLLFAQRRLDEKLEIYDQDLHTFQQEIDDSQQQKNDLQNKLAELHTRAQTMEKDIEQLEQDKKLSQKRKEEKGEQITVLKVDLARKMQTFEGLQADVSRLEQTKQELDDEWHFIQEQLQRLEGNLHEQDDEEDSMAEQLREKKEQKDQLTQQINDWRQQRKTDKQLIEQLEINLKEIQKELRMLEDAAHQVEVQVNRLDVELENNLSQLREEYELSFELAKEQYPLEDEYDTVKQEVDALKLQIQQLGAVNIGAIEEFERLEERYQFLKSQEEDLVQAKEKLYQVIAEMDEEMTKRFKETFDLVREQFQDVFQELFGGGRADLILSDPDNLLTTGIDIIAQPPGKKLQYLALLSGGEKALTAIALLFSILRVKPVPFCVLDEVEAALDEANVTRFSEYLRAFSEKTQFIVITHRKGTMEGADVLYGITMQESGVSNLVSVKLEEKDDPITA